MSFELTAHDADNDSLTYEIIPPSHGRLVGTAPGLSYVPDNHFRGADAFSFKVNDGAADSNVVSIKITVRSQDLDDRKDNDHWWEKTPETTDKEVILLPPIVEDTEAPVIPVQPVKFAPDFLPIPPVVSDEAKSEILEASKVEAADLIMKDLVAPQLVFPASILEALAPTLAGTVVDYSVSAVDGVDGELAATCSPISGTRFPVGRFNVVCHAVDTAGNSVLSSFVVVVRQASNVDGALPAFLVPTIIALLGAGGYTGFRMIGWLRSRRPNGTA